MPQVGIFFRLSKAEVKILNGKCKADKKSRYATLQTLARKYMTGQITITETTNQVQELKREIERIRAIHERDLQEKDAIIAELKKECNVFNIQNPENISILKKLFEWAQKIAMHDYIPRKLTDKELNFIFKFLHGENLQF